MDLNEHLAKIVEGLIGEITANVLARVDSVISSTVTDRLTNYNYEAHIKEAATAALDRRAAEYTVDAKRLEKRIAERIELVLGEVQANTSELINSTVTARIAKINFNQAMTDAASSIIAERLKDYVFPANSINGDALKLSDLVITGDNVKGGIIENFSSTGIDDRATGVAVTVLDHATVVENNLFTQDLTVEGTATINGNLNVTGVVDEQSNFYQDLVSRTTTSALANMDRGLFDSYSSLVFNQIKTDGLDLSRILLNGAEVVAGNHLGSTIISSNLQHLGLLKELQVSGEAIVAETLYVTPKRVGINTIEPSGALAIWDQEVEIVAAKKSADTGSFGTPRQQRFVLTANNKENIVLETDGSATINELRMGSMKFSAAAQPPNYVGERGHVVWNTNPNPGGPMGWICLGATNWANFGIID
jgi:uncharacterized protein (DUF2164 family)